MTILINIFIVIILITVYILLSKYLEKYIIVYRLNNKKINIFLLGIIPILSINYENINDIYKEAFWAIFIKYNPYQVFFIENNVIGQRILIELKRYFIIKYIVITPDNPEKFIEEINQRIAKTKGEIC